jgi:hypothetical protein
VLLVDPAAAMPPLERAIVADRAAGRRSPLVTSLSMASVAANMAGDRPAARRLIDEAQGVGGDLDVIAAQALLQALALDRFFAGDVERAAAASLAGVRLARDAGDLYTLKVWLLNRGTAALVAGDLDAAAPMLAGALQLAHPAGRCRRGPRERRPGTAVAARARGGPAHRRRPDQQEIGARLFISEHTVDTHVRGILNKLGFDSRARIAAWISARERTGSPRSVGRPEDVGAQEHHTPSETRVPDRASADGWVTRARAVVYSQRKTRAATAPARTRMSASTATSGARLAHVSPTHRPRISRTT